MFATVFFTCKKAPDVGLDNRLETKISSSGEKKVKVISPNYNFSSQQVCKLIRTFKSEKQIEAKSTELEIDSDSLQLDSAQYLLEATINFDFDSESDDATKTEYVVSTYTFNYIFNETTNEYKISTSDLIDVYDQISNSLNNIISEDSTYISAVDVQGYITEENLAYFEVTTAKMLRSYIFKCNYFTGYNSSFLYYLLAPSTAIQLRLPFSCVIDPATTAASGGFQDASNTFGSKLNCKDTYRKCHQQGSKGFYSQVTNPFVYSPNSNTDVNLPFITLQPQANYCNGTYWSNINYFSGSQILSFLSNSHNLISASASGSYQLIDNGASITPIFNGPGVSSPYNLSYYWQLTWMNGIWGCKVIED